MEFVIPVPLSYSLVTSKGIELEKVSLIDMQSFGLLVYSFAANDKYRIFYRDNLTIPIHFETKEDRLRVCIFEIKDSKNVA